MSLRNQGQPHGFAGVAAPMMSRAIGRANRKDLAKLKQVIKSQGASR